VREQRPEDPAAVHRERREEIEHRQHDVRDADLAQDEREDRRGPAESLQAGQTDDPEDHGGDRSRDDDPELALALLWNSRKLARPPRIHSVMDSTWRPYRRPTQECPSSLTSTDANRPTPAARPTSHGVFPSPSVATSIGSAVNVSIDPA
jgi:hypothetical protein